MAKSKSAVPWLARRFLLSQHADGFLSMISWVSVLGVMLGVASLVVVTSVINGFRGELTQVITGMNGEVVLYSRAEPLAESDKIQQKIRSALPEVVAITPSFISELMVSGQGTVSGAILEGIDSETVSSVTRVEKRVTEGRMPEADGEYVAGAALAEKLAIKVGDEIKIIIPFSGAGEDDLSAPKVSVGKLVGIAKMGMFDYDSKYVFGTISGVRKILDQPSDRVTALKLKLRPGAPARAISDRLSEMFGYPFRAKDWGQLNKNLFYAIELEKVVISVIMTAVILVAAFNVVSTLMMMIHDKAKEIAILKAMGFRRRQGFGLFCLIGMGIGIIGTLAGVSLGLGLNELLARTKWVELPADIYRIGHLPVVVNWLEVGLICALALMITFAATVYPAYRVSTRPPLEGIRYE